MKIKSKYLLFLVAIFFNALSACVAQALRDTSRLYLFNDSIVSVNSYLYVYREIKADKTFPEILTMNQHEFVPLNNTLYYFSEAPEVSVYWLRCTIVNQDAIDYRGVFYFLTGLDSVEMYQKTSGNLWKKSFNSALLPTHQRELYLSQELAFPVVLTPGEQTIYFRIASASVWSRARGAILLNLVQEKSFINYFLEYRHYHGLALGMITVMIIFHFFIYFFLQDRTYLAFLFNISITLLFLLIMKHYHEEIPILGSALPVIRYLHDPAGAMVSLSALLFTMYFLNTRETDLLMHRVMSVTCIVLALLVVLMIFLVRLDLLNQISMILGILTSIVVVIASIRGIAKNKFAWYILIGFLFVFFVPIMYILQFLGKFPFRSTASDFHYFSEAFRSIVFAVGIANRFYFIKQEAVRQRLEKNRLELEKEKQIRAERERIAQDLHDSVGAQLALLTRGLQRLNNQNYYSREYIDELSNLATVATNDLRNTIWAIEKEVVTMEEFCNKVLNIFWRFADLYLIKFDVIPPANASRLLLRSESAINAFRIIQEAISNSIKHSGATLLTFSISPVENNFFKFCVHDNGHGFDPQNIDQENHFGLRNMERRAQQLHSKIEIMSRKEEGTKISFILLVEIS